MPHRVDASSPEHPAQRLPYDVVRGSPPPSMHTHSPAPSNGEWSGNPSALTVSPTPPGYAAHGSPYAPPMYAPPPPPPGFAGQGYYNAPGPSYHHHHHHNPYHPPPPPTPYHGHYADWQPQAQAQGQQQQQQGYPLAGPGAQAPDMSIVYTDDSATRLSERVRRKCFNCTTTEASTWRKSTLALGKVLCNKCGLYERTHQRPRPSNKDMYRASGAASRERGPLASAAVARAPGKARGGKSARGRGRGRGGKAQAQGHVVGEEDPAAEMMTFPYPPMPDSTSASSSSSSYTYAPPPPPNNGYASPYASPYPPPSGTPPSLSHSLQSLSQPHTPPLSNGNGKPHSQSESQSPEACVQMDGSLGLSLKRTNGGAGVGVGGNAGMNGNGGVNGGMNGNGKAKTSVRAWDD